MLANPERFENAGLLGRDPHGALGLLGFVDRIQPKDFHAARSRFQFSRDLAQEGRFARAVRAEDRYKFSAPHFEIDTAIGFRAVAILLCKTTHTDRRARVVAWRLPFRGARFSRDWLVDLADYGSAQGFRSQLNCMKSIADRIAVNGLLRYAETSYGQPILQPLQKSHMSGDC